MITAAFIVAIGAAYVVIGGAFGGSDYRRGKAACDDSRTAYRCYHEHFLRAAGIGAFWPLAFLIVFGANIGTREERRQERELAAAEHRRKLEEERAKEDEALDRRLRIVNGGRS